MAKIHLAVLEVLYFLLMATKMVEGQAKTGCPTKCGEVDVPYPFGIQPGCYRKNFDLKCDKTSTPPKLRLGTTEVVNIKLMEGKVHGLGFITSRHCFDTTGNPTNDTLDTYNDMRSSPYSFSSDVNVFAAIGCDTIASMVDPLKYHFTTGCISTCNKDPQGMPLFHTRNGTCVGVGCCQVSFPPGLKYMSIRLVSLNNHTNVSSFNPCSYAFLVERDAFEFDPSLLSTAIATSKTLRVPTVLDWSIEGDTCETAKPKTDYACKSENSECFASKNGLGYLCKCSPGYNGNPYLHDGCQSGVDRGASASHTKATWKMMLGFISLMSSPLFFVF